MNASLRIFNIYGGGGMVSDQLVQSDEVHEDQPKDGQCLVW